MKILIFLATTLLIHSALSLETAPYKVIQPISKKVEIREYPELLLATMASLEEKKRNKGFRFLFGFISGNNSKDKKIPMTTPVFIRKDKKEYQMSFVLPKEYNLKNIPQPGNKKVRITKFQKDKFIAMRFTGRPSKKNLKKNREILENIIQEKKIIADTKNPIYAYYSSPWTLPKLRRNEILFRVNR